MGAFLRAAGGTFVATFVAVSLAVTAIINTGLSMHVLDYVAADADAIDAVIVLGNAVLEDGSPSERLARRAEVGLEATRRLSDSRRGSPLLVLTGGIGTHPPSEAESARRYLEASFLGDTRIGPTATIVEEAASTSTLENFAFTSAILDAARATRGAAQSAKGLAEAMNAEHLSLARRRELPRSDGARYEGTVVFVTDAFHAPRAHLLCRSFFSDCRAAVTPLGPLWREFAWTTREIAALVWHHISVLRGTRPDTGLRFNFPF